MGSRTRKRGRGGVVTTSSEPKEKTEYSLKELQDECEDAIRRGGMPFDEGSSRKPIGVHPATLPGWKPKLGNLANIADQLQLVQGGLNLGKPSVVPDRERYPNAITGADLSEERLSRAVWFTIPDTETKENPQGRGFWVHPMSSEDARDMFAHSGPFLRQAQGARNQTEKEFLLSIAQYDLLVLNVIASCRQGRERSSPRCFDWSEHAKVSRYLEGGLVAQVASIVDELSYSRDPEREAIQAFFQRVGAYFTTLYSQLNTWPDCPPGLKAEAQELALHGQQLSSPRIQRLAVDSESMS